MIDLFTRCFDVSVFSAVLLIAALFQTRKILNGLIKTYGDINEIQADLSADLKVNKFQRYLYRLDQKRQSPVDRI